MKKWAGTEKQRRKKQGTVECLNYLHSMTVTLKSKNVHKCKFHG